MESIDPNKRSEHAHPLTTNRSSSKAHTCELCTGAREGCSGRQGAEDGGTRQSLAGTEDEAPVEAGAIHRRLSGIISSLLPKPKIIRANTRTRNVLFASQNLQSPESLAALTCSACLGTLHVPHSETMLNFH